MPQQEGYDGMAKNAQLRLIFGDDEFPVTAKGKDVVSELVPPAERALGLETIDGNVDTVEQALSAVRRCIEALQTQGFLSDGKVVWLCDANFLSETVVGRSASVKSLLGELVAVLDGGLPKGQTLVVTSPKVDKRSSFYKACKRLGEIEEFSLPDKAYKSEAHAKATAESELKRRGLRMRGDALAMFLEKAGTETRQIVNEIEKLQVHAGHRKEITVDDVRDIACSSREIVAWDFTDAVGERNIGKALNSLTQLLAQKESPIGLLLTVQSRVNDLIIFRESLDRGWLRMKGSGDWRTVEWSVPSELDGTFANLAQRDVRAMHPYRAGKLAQQAEKYSLSKLKRCRELAIEAHEQVVSAGAPQKLVLEMLVVKMLGRKRSGASPKQRAGRA